MKHAFKTIAFAIAVACCTTPAISADQVRVGFTAEPYPPFQSIDAAGNWVGWEVDFMKAVCAEAKLDCAIAPVSWDGLIPALTSGKIDMIMATMRITDERLKTIDFTDKYFSSPSGIIAAKEQDIKPTAESLKDKIIGMQVGTTHQTYAQKYFEPNGTQVKTYQNQDDAYNDLAAGRIDAVQADTTSFEGFLKSSAGGCCELKGNVESDPAIFGRGAGIGMRKSDSELKARLNAAIKAIRANGTYEKFSKKYFSFDVYGE